MGYAVIVGAAYSSIVLGVLLSELPALALLALLTLPMAWKAFKVLRRHHSFPYRLLPANATTIFNHLLTGMLLMLCYTIAGFSRFL